MKFVSHIEAKLNTPEDFIDYYKSMTKVLIVQAKKLYIPNRILGMLFLSAAVAFLKTYLKNPTKGNLMRHFEEACDKMEGR